MALCYMRAEFLTNLEINYLCKVLYYKARTELDNAMASDSERIDTLHRRQNYLELKRVWCRTRTNDRIDNLNARIAIRLTNIAMTISIMCLYDDNWMCITELLVIA